MLKRHILAILSVLSVLSSILPCSALILRPDVSPKPRIGDFRTCQSQGREWDARRQDYYFRNRIYVPEWGSFTGPDMNLANGIEGEPNGVGNYVFCENDPLDNVDPSGLGATMGADYADMASTLYTIQATGGSIKEAIQHNADACKVAGPEVAAAFVPRPDLTYKMGKGFADQAADPTLSRFDRRMAAIGMVSADILTIGEFIPGINVAENLVIRGTRKVLLHEAEELVVHEASSTATKMEAKAVAVADQTSSKLTPRNYPNPDPPMTVSPARYEPTTVEEVVKMRQGRGPTTKATHGTDNIEAHHRQQVPIEEGGVMDELTQETHRGPGAQTRHSQPSRLTPAKRAKEIREHYVERGSEYLLPGEGI